MKKKPLSIMAVSTLAIVAVGGYVYYTNHQDLNSAPVAVASHKNVQKHNHIIHNVELSTSSGKRLGVKSKVNRHYASQPNVYYTNRVVIVTFHDMSSTLVSPWNMSAQLFNDDLTAIQQNHFHVISNSEFIGWLNHQNSIPDNAVLLTFDDGYRSMYTRALPILLQHHMTGTFFDIVFRPDTNSPGFMSWGDLQTLVRDGMTVEAHTYNSHYEVTVDGKQVPVFDTPIVVNGKKETWHQYFMRDYKDFSKAKTELETHLGVPVTEFAWPYGWGTHAATIAAEDAGYQYLFTTTWGEVTPWTNPLAIPRIDIGEPNVTPQQAIQDILKTAGVQPNEDTTVNQSSKL